MEFFASSCTESVWYGHTGLTGIPGHPVDFGTMYEKTQSYNYVFVFLYLSRTEVKAVSSSFFYE